jgi:hypothetical protein
VKCEDCLPLIEEYVDGELDGRNAERVETHLLACAGCANELATFKREQEIYAHYRRDVEVTPAQWQIVRARIEQERETNQAAPSESLRERLRKAFPPRKHFHPAFAAALVLIVIGITASIIYLNPRPSRNDRASGPSKPIDPNLPIGAPGAVPTVVKVEKDETIAQDAGAKNGGHKERAPEKAVVARNTPRTSGQKRTAAAPAAIALRPRPENRGVEQPSTPDASARFEMAVAGNMTTGLRRGDELGGAGDFDFEIARHARRSELLLRSFRNVRLSASHRSLDVSYEKGNARKLLYRNITLRRDAAARGDETAAQLLSQLEPLLLDIANLPDRAKARDVRSIEQRMEKKEIVATLQVRTLVASN